MFRVFKAVLCLAIVSIVGVNCARDDTIAELTAQLTYLARACFSSEISEMKLHHLADRNVTCNDGSPAGYYLRKVYNSTRWIVYLEGGWFCDSAASCRKRHHHHTMRQLMTSKGWKGSKRGMGILSPNPQENPSWWNANHVYVPYCSSDAWSGNASRQETGERFSFLGTRILARVIDELLEEGLDHAKHLLLAGSSAGGIGVILNLDRIATRLKESGSTVSVRGLADSAWNLPRNLAGKGARTKKCLVGKGTNCEPAEAIKRGMAYWRGVVPDDCARRNPNDKWKCYFGEHVYSTDIHSPKHSPLFVFQWLYDIAQLAWIVSGSYEIGTLTPHEQKIVERNLLHLGKNLTISLNRLDHCAVFAPSCISHTILTRNDWLKVRVSGKTLNDALDDWYDSSDRSSASCKKLIESDCHLPQCDKTCPEFPSLPTARQSSRSPGVPNNSEPRGRLESKRKKSRG